MNNWLQRNIDYGYSDDYLADLMDRMNRKMVVMGENGRPTTLDFENFFGRPLLGKVLCMHWEGARDFHCDRPWACISIATHKKEQLQPSWWKGSVHPEYSKENRVDLLELEFSDALGTTYTNYNGHVIDLTDPKQVTVQCFQKKHAEQIVNFVHKNWNRIDILMVRGAYAGGRAAAVSMAICDYYHPELSKHLKVYHPNPYIHKTLSEVFESQKDLAMAN